ncbi:hypothetical protein JCM10207_006502 [Rhodosporidiobolus poonsookiae]
MAASFIGLPVLIKLRSNPHDSVQGTLSSLDPTHGTITLSEAQSTTNGVQRLVGLLVLRREEVAGLELLSVDRPGAVLPPLNGHAVPRPEQDGVRRVQPQPVPQQRPTPPQHPISVPSPGPSPSPLSAATKTSRRSHRGGRRNKMRDEPLEPDGGDEADMSTAYTEDSHSRRRQQVSRQPQGQSFTEDFDFAGGLNSFDKARVFDEIRSNDSTDPSLRLVAHNRNPARALMPQTKLLPTESVLSAQELHAQQHERLQAVAARANATAGSVGGASASPAPGSAASGRGETTEGEGSASEFEAMANQGIRRVQSQLGGLALGAGSGEGGGLVTSRGVRVPVIKTRQWKEALSIADIESFPTATQRLESTAHSLVSYILTSLCSTLRLFPPPNPPHARPSILLLCTDSDKGAAALRAGVLLANRGCRVAALVPPAAAGPEEEGRGSEAWRTGLRVLSSAGGRIVRELADLAPTYNLLVDALSPSLSASGTSALSSSVPASAATSPRPDLPHAASSSFALFGAGAAAFAEEAVRWANGVDAPRLSVEVPWGLDADTGAPLSSLSPSAPFAATHLLALGLPRPALLTLLAHTHTQGTLEGAAVADIGLPPALWERVGVEGFDAGVWGCEGVVELRRG